MEKQIRTKIEYNSLDKVLDFLTSESDLDCSKVYDSWDVRTDANGQMEQCVVIKKSAMHAMKVYLSDDRILQMTHIIPNKLMNAYFGKSEKQYKNIIEIITGKISQALLSGSQKSAFYEIEEVLLKIAA